MIKVCPRCESKQISEVHAGTEDGVRVWGVWSCGHCAFTWRDTESAEVIDPGRRPKWAQLKGIDLDTLRQLFEPQRRSSEDGSQ